jgi:hypothetical protein
LLKVEDDPQRRLELELTADDPSLRGEKKEGCSHTSAGNFRPKEASRGSQTIIELSDYSVQ